MRHKVRGRTLGRKKAPREALLRNLAVSLIEKGKITTTTAKAKELRPFIEKIVTRAKEDSVANRRIAESSLHSKKAVQKLFKDIGPKYSSRPGGYTRIIRVGSRLGDNAPSSIIEFVEDTAEKTTEKTT